MGLRDDLRRFNEVGDEKREDLKEFIEHGNIGASGPDSVKFPIKIIDLPEFVYEPREAGGVGQGDGADVGDPVDIDADGDGDEEGEPGDEEGDHGYYEMDPEDFAEELDQELGLDLDPKGKRVKEEVEGDLTDTALAGPRSLMRDDVVIGEAIKRKLALSFDEQFMREVLKIDGWGPRTAFEWARSDADPIIPVGMSWLETEYDRIPSGERTEWESIEAVEENVDRTPIQQRIREDGLESLPLQRDDEEYHHPEIEKKREKNVVVVNIRDVSGSMREKKRELVERVFTPLDWYLRGKYDNIETVYIAHDISAWEVTREDFFGIKSGGGTKISSAYKLAKEILDERYPWTEWNRYVFAAGDGENSANDSEDEVLPLMNDIDANLHAYLETQPDGGGAMWAKHADILEEVIDNDGFPNQDVAVAHVHDNDDVLDAIYEILSTEGTPEPKPAEE